jgi:hypothetical protein
MQVFMPNVGDSGTAIKPHRAKNCILVHGATRPSKVIIEGPADMACCSKLKNPPGSHKPTRRAGIRKFEKTYLSSSLGCLGLLILFEDSREA